ncbi:MAG TPA: M1 family metallopeptidase [Gemmatimonas sp.]|uniref:M1 family metallopeptidase n=1 Tax=Gemmatimonas sp. TaxID=1962908 RepID=UPI002EDAC9F0
MFRSSVFVPVRAALAALALTVVPTGAHAQTAAARPAATTAAGQRPPRAVRRDIPITNAIRRAMSAGVRDSTGRPGARYWQLRTDYQIDVSLDPASARLTGKARITLHNTSPDSLREIGLRLDPNHFIGTAPHAAPWVPAEITDGMQFSRMTVNGAVVNIASNAAPQAAGAEGARAIQTAQAAAANAAGENTLLNGRSTNARIRLAMPVLPGARAVLEVDWSHKLPGGPGTGHRMTQRWADTLFQPTQWFPRVAKYDDLRGWDAELYLGPSEFYNNFGTFDVNVDVPAGWIVSGTGLLQNPEQVLTARAREQLAKVTQSDAVTMIVGPDEVGPGQATATSNTGRLTWRFHADTVNDFAWATAKKYVWQATRATIPGKGPVPIHMLFLPGRANVFERAPQITRHALEFYSKLWFPYQFPQLTLQDGPSAGMEYPMVINSNQGAADHETAHQWWPMVVGNNETWYGWMDEGFNQYMNILSAADAAGRAPVLDGEGQKYGQTSGNEAEAPMMWNANYGGPGFYGFTTYSKTPLMLSMLGGIVGDSAVQRAHREWANAWLFKHPSPWDYMFFMNKALGRDLGWFWYSWLFTTGSVDGRIASVKTVAGRMSVTVAQDGDMPAPIVLKVSFAAKGAPIRPMKNAVMLDETTALVTVPVDVWFNGARSVTTDLMFGARPIEKIVLDPNRRFPDRNPADNEWPVAAQTLPATPRR